MSHPHSSHPQPRTKRGIIQVAVVALLRERDMHGYQMIQEVSERTGGAWAPSPGSVYPALKSLEESGMISAVESGDKRVFSLTDLGKKHARMIPAGEPWLQVTEDENSLSRKLRSATGELMVAVSQASDVATEQQLADTISLLTDTKRRIYLLLAGEE